MNPARSSLRRAVFPVALATAAALLAACGSNSGDTTATANEQAVE